MFKYISISLFILFNIFKTYVHKIVFAIDWFSYYFNILFKLFVFNVYMFLINAQVNLLYYVHLLLNIYIFFVGDIIGWISSRHIHMGARRGVVRRGTCLPPGNRKIYAPPPKDNLTLKKWKKNISSRGPHIVSEETDLRVLTYNK